MSNKITNSGEILKSDTLVAKNYLNEKELSRLNRLVNMFMPSWPGAGSASRSCIRTARSRLPARTAPIWTNAASDTL